MPLLTHWQQHRHCSSPSPLTPFQQTQLEAEETFYAVFPTTWLAKLAEQQQLVYLNTVSFYYDTHPDPALYHVDPFGTGYINGAYIAVGGNKFSSTRPPHPVDEYIHDPSEFLHYNYGLTNTNTASSIQSFPPILVAKKIQLKNFSAAAVPFHMHTKFPTFEFLACS